MFQFVLQRLMALVPVWLGVSLLAFGLGHLAPGDPAQLVAAQRAGGTPSDDQIAQARSELGLDRPLVTQYARWLGQVVRGNFGQSYRSGAAVFDELTSRLPATLELALAGFAVSLFIALPLGVIAATQRDKLLDHLTRLLALAGSSLPGFWLAFLLIILFAVQWHWLPVMGRNDWRNLVLPALALGFGASASLLRLTRSSMLDVLSEDYIRTARAKGLSASNVTLRHALRNALLPVITAAGLRFGFLLGGAAIIEVIFAWPGVGRLLVESISTRDYPLIQGYVLLMGTIFLLINLLVDVGYVWLDPRVQLAGAKKA